MDIYFNNLKYKLQNSKNILELLEELKIEKTRGIAIALNQEVVPKEEWKTRFLKQEDKLTVIQATQGG